MKIRLIRISIITFLLFCLTSCSNSVISENVDYKSVDETVDAISGDRIIYSTYEELSEHIYPQRVIIFAGKKTGESKQKIPVSDDSNVNGLFFTESVLEVTEAYYGDISEGDKVIYHEYYAVFTDENGKKTLACDPSAPPVDENMQLFVLYTSSEAELFEGKRYHSMITPTDLQNSSKNSADGLAGFLVNKYFVNKDTAISKTELARQAVNHNAEMFSRGNFAKNDEETYSKCEALLQNKDADFDTLSQGLTEKDRELITRLISKYGK